GRAARASSSAPSSRDCELIPQARDILIAGEIPPVRGGDPSLDLADLPGVQRDVILDRAGDEPIARTFGLFGEPIEGVERRFLDADGEGCGHRAPPFA